MPELPEVETIKRDLAQLIVGRKIEAMSFDVAKQLQPAPEAVKAAAVGEVIKAVGRRAKIIQIFLGNGKILTVHLKLTGRLLVRDKGEKADVWQHVIFSLSGGKELRFCDLRKFGWVRLVESEAQLKIILAEFGPEPLADLDLGGFEKILAGTRRAVKIVLMDQTKISGVGNIYANDALWLARIDPRRPAVSLDKEERQKLFEALEKVLRAGISYRGASDNHYLDALGRKGKYQEHFLVYGRTGKPCFNCGGKIVRIAIGGRGSFYCPGCQK